MITANIECGQLVEVRKRQWVVTEINKSAFGGSEAQHLVSLISLDEDASDETLQVVWEIEPGARVLESAGLPVINGWDEHEKLEAFLDAIRWGGSVNADRSFIQAPFRSGIQIKDYQLDPLVRAIDMARVKLLIADDVGLGKTIEAGLVIQELISRHRARSVLIVCPASLQEKWKVEMHSRFGLDFKIVNTEFIKQLRRERGIQANPWSSFPRLIASMDWMKTGEGLRLMKDCLPPQANYPRKFDMLVVDEAHNVSPSGSLNYAIPSLRTQLIRTIAPHFEHRLFLSATPHNGFQQSFTALLELLDDQSCVRGVMPEEKVRKRLIVRRLKSDLPGFANRELHALQVNYSEEEKNAHSLLKEYSTLREGQGLGSAFIQKLLKKRLFSSPRAFAATLQKHKETMEGKRDAPARQKSSIKTRILRKALERAEEDYADDSKFEQAIEDAIVAATENESYPLTSDQSQVLNRLLSWANQNANRKDSKSEAILQWLEGHLKTDGQGNGKRVILFTEYRATHSWLFELLTANGWGGDLIESLHGGTDEKDREKIKAAFQAHPEKAPVRILLATDAASEGIDLQNHCNYMIHVEIPWNPNVLEQRNGRIDRFGQKQDKVHIWHPVGSRLPKDTLSDETNPGDLDGDLEFLLILARKVNNQREDLGALSPVLIKQAEEIMLGNRRTLDTKTVEEKAEVARRYVAAEKELKQKIERLHDRVLQTRKDFHITPERIERAVSIALKIAEKPSLKPANLVGLNGSANAFEVPILTGSWEQATEGLIDPHDGKRRPISFDHQLVENRDDVVLAHLQHKLVQMCLRLLRMEVWAAPESAKIHRVSIRKIPSSLAQEPQVIVWSRLVVTGGTRYRLHEELTFAGGELKTSGFARERTIGRLEEMLQAAQPATPDDALFQRLQLGFQSNKDNVMQAVNARSRERLQFLMNTLERRRDKELDDVENLLDELEKMIKKELEDSKKPEQLDFYEKLQSDERETLQRDLNSLSARLERIPEEREEEKKNLLRRYEEPTDRTFPVAVEFLVPEHLFTR